MTCAFSGMILKDQKKKNEPNKQKTQKERKKELIQELFVMKNQLLVAELYYFQKSH